MFEDSLVESTGRIRTRSRQLAVGSFALQSLLLSALAIYPYLHPATLPKQALTMLLTAPAPPAAPASLPQRASAAPRAQQPISISDLLTAPSHIPQHAAVGVTESTAPAGADDGFSQIGTGSIPTDLIGRLPGTPEVKPAPLKGPIRVSSGVAAGLLLTPIQPVYPAIARAARIQGTVVVQATISKAGTIENLHVVSGPPMLQSAAVEAIRKARYRPFLLNEEPVVVETTINVVFTF
jgi:periplasmic protein TonB